MEQVVAADNPAVVQALDIFVDRIRRGKIRYGQPLKETVIAQQENLSRNAVRETLSQLVGFGVIDYRPFCGYRMRTFTDQDRLEWYELREAIEPLAARRLAYLRPAHSLKKLQMIIDGQRKALEAKDQAAFCSADLNFHVALVEECGNHCFARQQNHIYMAALFMNDDEADADKNERSASFYHYTPEENDIATLQAHANILQLIAEGKAVEAEDLVRCHCHIQVEAMIQYIALHPERRK